MFFAFVLSFLSAISAQAASSPTNQLFSTQDKQVFTLKFIDTSAGELELETLAPTTWEGKPVYHFRATVRSIGLFWVIYPFTQVADIYYDKQKNIPLHVEVTLKDRYKNQLTKIKLDEKTQRGEELEDSTESDGRKNHRRKQWGISPMSQSIFSVLHFLRLQQLKVGQKITFPVAHDEKNGVFEGEVTGLEKIKVPKGQEKEAIVVKVSKEFASKFRGSIQSEPILWLSNDAHKRLLKFEFKHRRGKVFAVLKTPVP